MCIMYEYSTISVSHIDNVLHFLTGLSSSLKPFATRDYDLMRSIKASLATSTTQVLHLKWLLKNIVHYSTQLLE